MRLLLAAAALGAANAAKAPGSAQYAAIRPALDEIASLRAHVDGGACVPDLGAKADALCAAAEARVVADGGDAKAVRDVEKRLDALLRSIYAKQLRTARAAAVQAFRRAKLGGEYDALIKAREEFTALAEAASRAEWTYDEDERELEAALLAVSRASAAARDATIAAAQQRASVFAVLRKLVLELSAATAKRLGNDADCDAGLAARVPATNINLSGALQRGKSSLQISCVPDDSAALLGASGFNKPRVGAGDLARGHVLLLDGRPRREQLVREGAVRGKEEETRRVRVEAAHGVRLARRHDREVGPAAVVAQRAVHADRLVVRPQQRQRFN